MNLDISTIISLVIETANNIERAKPKGGPEWEGPGEEWWEWFLEELQEQIEIHMDR